MVIMYKGTVFGTWSRTQKPITHSSCEAELTSAHQGVSEGTQLVNMLKKTFEIIG